MDKFKLQLASMCCHLADALKTVYGWVIAALLALLNFLQPEAYAFGAVFALIVLDAIFGYWASKKQGKGFLSDEFKSTPAKIAIYYSAMISVFVLERITHQDGAMFTVKSVAIIAGISEIWSMTASMLIIWPNMPFVKIFREQLKSEIESKVNKSASDELK